jgi:hypothetical protein
MDTHRLHTQDLSQDQCERALCYHLMSGLCTDIPTNSNLKRNACSDISRSSSSVIKLKLAISQLVLNTIAPHLCMNCLHKLCAAMDLCDDTQNSHRSLIAALKTCYNNLQAAIKNGSLRNLFNHFELMRKPMLLSIAIGHGLSVDCKSTIDDLKNAIFAHVSHGQCHSDQDGSCPPHCKSICHEFSDEIQVPYSTFELKLEIKSPLWTGLLLFHCDTC